MIVNPNKIAKGRLRIDSSIKNIDPNAAKFKVQQNGIDLTIEEVFRVKEGDSSGYSSAPLLHSDGRELPFYGEVRSAEMVANCTAENVYRLEKGECYSIETNQEVVVPSDMCAQIIQRSSLNRMGLFIQSGLYDSGFKGRIGFMIYCFNTIYIQKGSRVAQIIFMKAEAASQYKGQYQNQ